MGYPPVPLNPPGDAKRLSWCSPSGLGRIAEGSGGRVGTFVFKKNLIVTVTFLHERGLTGPLKTSKLRN